MGRRLTSETGSKDAAKRASARGRPWRRSDPHREAQRCFRAQYALQPRWKHPLGDYQERSPDPLVFPGLGKGHKVSGTGATGKTWQWSLSHKSPSLIYAKTVMTISDFNTMHWCVIQLKISLFPRKRESTEGGLGRRLTSETGSMISSLPRRICAGGSVMSFLPHLQKDAKAFRQIIALDQARDREDLERRSESSSAPTLRTRPTLEPTPPRRETVRDPAERRPTDGVQAATAPLDRTG